MTLWNGYVLLAILWILEKLNQCPHSLPEINLCCDKSSQTSKKDENYLKKDENVPKKNLKNRKLDKKV